jgi:hypothetical protein
MYRQKDVFKQKDLSFFMLYQTKYSVDEDILQIKTNIPCFHVNASDCPVLISSFLTTVVMSSI